MNRNPNALLQGVVLAVLGTTTAAAFATVPVVPEPGALGLFGAGAAVVVIGIRWMRRH